MKESPNLCQIIHKGLVKEQENFEIRVGVETIQTTALSR